MHAFKRSLAPRMRRSAGQIVVGVWLVRAGVFRGPAPRASLRAPMRANGNAAVIPRFGMVATGRQGAAA